MASGRVEAPGRVRTKIVATVGPASRSGETLRAMAAAGADLFRINCSHGTADERAEALRAIREVERGEGRPIGVLLDLAGPKLRLGAIAGGEVECRTGEAFTLGPPAGERPDDPHRLTCSYQDLPKDLKPGETVLFADGEVAMRVGASDGREAHLTVTDPGRLRSHQGINLPGTALNLPALTDKDLADLDWAAGQGVDYIGQSFVRKAADVAWLRRELEARGCRAKIVAKIEKPQALDDLEAIVAGSDAVMVARGDLGVEMDVARVPAAQKRVIAACHRARRPVITATQMLASMEAARRPTRAEASDVFNAVLDGTDAVMLSGETAIGAYPVEAVATMSRIAAEAEALLLGSSCESGAGPAFVGNSDDEPLGAEADLGRITPITEAVVEAAARVGRRLEAALVVVATQSGRTALALSKRRQAAPTVALAGDLGVSRAMTLYWGVSPLHCPEAADVERALAIALEWARRHALVARGDRIVLIRGTMPGNPAHNAMLVEEVG